MAEHIEADRTLVAGAVESGRGRHRGRRLGRLRLAVVPDASAASLEGFAASTLEAEAAVTIDGWSSYLGLAKRWLPGTPHGAVRRKHLQASLDA